MMKFLKSLFGQIDKTNPSSDISMYEFRERVILRLHELAPDIHVTRTPEIPNGLSVKTDDGTTGQCDLNNNFKNLVLFDGSVDEEVESAVQAILLGARSTPPISLNDILPLIRTSIYLENSTDEVRVRVSRHFQGELYEICMADTPTALRGLTSDDLVTLNTDDVISAAHDNVRKLLSKTYSDDSLGFATLYSIEDHAHLGPSLILFDEFWVDADMRFPDGCIIAVPRRDQLFLLDLADPNVIENANHLIRVTFEDDFNLLTQQLYVRKAGQISVLPPV